MSRRGFYGWCARLLSPRARELLRPEVKIGVLHRASRRTYGSLPISLRDAGEVGGRHRAARLMRQARIQAKTVHKFKATIDSDHCHPMAENLVTQDLTSAKSINRESRTIRRTAIRPRF